MQQSLSWGLAQIDVKSMHLLCKIDLAWMNDTQRWSQLGFQNTRKHVLTVWLPTSKPPTHVTELTTCSGAWHTYIQRRREQCQCIEVRVPRPYQSSKESIINHRKWFQHQEKRSKGDNRTTRRKQFKTRRNNNWREKEGANNFIWERKKENKNNKKFALGTPK